MSTIVLTTQTTPATPTTGKVRMFVDSADGIAKLINDAGAVTGMGGMQYLGGTVLTGNATSTSIVTIPAKKRLMILGNITGYGGTDIASLRFGGTGGTVDSGNNYWDRHLTSAAGGTTFTNSQNLSTSLIRLAGNAVIPGRVFTAHVMNFQTQSKSVQINVQTQTRAAGTAGVLNFGGGEWVNTTQQIVSVQMLTAGGSTMPAGTGFVVFGIDI